jgi:hypothetical protein
VPAFLAPVVSGGTFSAVGDFNGDARDDLVVLDQTAGTLAVRLGNGDGTFAPAGPTVSASTFESRIAVADFDGDGQRDVLLGTIRAASFALYRGNGDGSLQPGRFSPLPPPIGSYSFNWLTTFEIADMNNDGRPDIVARANEKFSSRGGERADADRLEVLLAGTDGSFARAGFPLGLGGEFLEGRTPILIPPPSAYHLADFDGDGNVDVLFVASAKPTKKATPYPSQILRGNGDGTFDKANPIAQNWVNKELAVADLNGDGKADLLQHGAGTTWKVHIGQGSGNFTQTDSVSLPGAPVVADVNGDGRTDLIAANSAAGSASVLLGKANGKFGPAKTFAVGPGPLGAPTIGDFNGDGRPDLTLSNLDSVFVLLNDGIW